MPAAVFSFAVQLADVPDTARVTVVYSDGGGPWRFEFTGAQTITVDISAMPAAGLKGLRIEFDATDAAGVTVTAPLSIHWTSNAIPKVEELSPDGVFMLASPSPTNGITALSLVSTANAVAHVVAVA